MNDDETKNKDSYVIEYQTYNQYMHSTFTNSKDEADLIYDGLKQLSHVTMVLNPRRVE